MRKSFTKNEKIVLQFCNKSLEIKKGVYKAFKPL